MPSIAQAAVQHQRFTASPTFSTDRMTWIKPGFMWMMYRSGWASKPNQEHILAVHLKRSWLFETLRTNAILSAHSSAGKTKGHDVVVQWDPDHDYLGQKLERRAVQIGLRGTAAAEYAAGIEGPAAVKIEDITQYVAHLRDTVISKLQPASDDKQQQQEEQQPDIFRHAHQGTAAVEAVEAASGNAAVSGRTSGDAALLGQLLVPVEHVMQLDDELKAVLGM